MKFFRFLMLPALLIMVGLLAGCGGGGKHLFPEHASKSPSHTQMLQLAKIKDLDPVKACVKPSVQGKRVALEPSINNTGRTNSVSDAGTGDFLPGTQTANFAIPLLKDELGMTVQSLTNMNGELAYRQYLTKAAVDERARAFAAAKPDYMLDVTALSLDFTQTRNDTAIVKGIGFYSNMQKATIAGGAKLKKGDGSQDIAGFDGMTLGVYSTQDGLMLGRVFGNILATGEAGVGNQQPMQQWDGEYVVNITTLGSITDLPGMPPECKRLLRKIVGPNYVTIASSS